MTTLTLTGEDWSREDRPQNRWRGQPVRRRSKLAGGAWEDGFRTELNVRDLNLTWKAAERFDETGRQKGQRNGPLGHVAIRLLKLLCGLAAAGRPITCSVATLAKMIRRSESAVHEAKAALKAHGFLDWCRRYVPVEGAQKGRGAPLGRQVEQTSNLYRVTFPEKARKLLGKFGFAPPVPADEETRKAEMSARLRELAKQQQEQDSPIIARAQKKANEVATKERNVDRPS